MSNDNTLDIRINEALFALNNFQPTLARIERVLADAMKNESPYNHNKPVLSELIAKYETMIIERNSSDLRTLVDLTYELRRWGIINEETSEWQSSDCYPDAPRSQQVWQGSNC